LSAVCPGCRLSGPLAAGGKPIDLTSDPATDAFPSFSRDGKWIYFTSDWESHDKIWKMPASGGKPTKVTGAVGYAATQSPDGHTSTT